VTEKPESADGRTRARTIRTGHVTDFDDPRGLGTVLSADGRRYGFHCTAIADGTRRIDVGVAVTFVLAPGHLGRLEARDIVASGGFSTGSVL
jgi:cold shock CspA family protein